MASASAVGRSAGVGSARHPFNPGSQERFAIAAARFAANPSSILNSKRRTATAKWLGLDSKHRHALIAQLGERQTEDLKVPCSIHGQGIFFFHSTWFKVSTRDTYM